MMGEDSTSHLIDSKEKFRNEHGGTLYAVTHVLPACPGERAF
jgi:hypothetical protein